MEMKLDLLELKGKSERNFRGWKIDEHRPADSLKKEDYGRGVFLTLILSPLENLVLIFLEFLYILLSFYKICLSFLSRLLEFFRNSDFGGNIGGILLIFACFMQF